MSIARLDLIERDLDDRVRHDRAYATVVLDGVLEKILRHLGDLLVGETGVRLADVEEALAVANRERVIGEDAAALAVSPLDRGHHHIEPAERPLHLEPLHAAPARPGRRARVPDHPAPVPALACPGGPAGG